MKEKKVDISLWIFGIVISLAAGVLTVLAINSSGVAYSSLIISGYIFYLLISSLIVANSVRPCEKKIHALTAYSLFDILFALICIEILFRILLGTDISAIALILGIANFPLVFFISALFLKILSYSEAVSIRTVKEQYRQSVYGQLNNEYLRLSKILTKLNAYSRLIKIENTRYDYLSLFPGINRQECDKARSKALRGIIDIPPAEREILDRLGFDGYYTDLNRRLFSVRAAKEEYDSVSTKEDFTAFTKKYNIFIEF